jgi:hypothetical protein
MLRSSVSCGVPQLSVVCFQILGELYHIYYNNRDLRLLLDLLATSSGIAPAIAIMTLFDKVAKHSCCLISKNRYLKNVWVLYFGPVINRHLLLTHPFLDLFSVILHIFFSLPKNFPLIFPVSSFFLHFPIFLFIFSPRITSAYPSRRKIPSPRTGGKDRPMLFGEKI